MSRRTAIANRVVVAAGLVTAALLASCKLGDAKQRYCLESEESGYCQPMRTSIEAIVGRSGEFHGRRVKIKGYAHIAINNSGIYPQQSDFDEWKSKRGLWLDVTRWDSGTVDHLVEVEGTFDRNNKGYLDNWAGAVTRIFRVRRVE